MKRKYTSLPFTELDVATGNFDTSRVQIDRIVIHTMVGTWQGAAARFAQYGQQASAHYGVKYTGGLIAWLEEYYTAYHAGDYTMNQRSIGIEHEDLGKYNDPRPDILYTTSSKLVADICTFYQIPCNRTTILKHSEVHATGCPDALDIDRIVREAQALLTPADPTVELKKQIAILNAKIEAARKALS
jgi:N-acetyl-anhydromuramyl-L-alanine amidase AmpD